jgi:hypothetical protein
MRTALQTDWVSELGSVCAGLVSLRDKAKGLVAHGLEIADPWVFISKEGVEVTLPDEVLNASGISRELLTATVLALVQLDQAVTDEMRSALRGAANRLPTQKG